jgi:predicted dehydrogenase
MTKNAIRVGIIGAGGNTKLMHIPRLRAIPGVSMVAVSNSSPESSRKAAGELGIPAAIDRWEDLAADPGVDAVLIGTWPNMHCPCTIAALGAGKHVLCEARMAMNAAEAHRMLDCSARHPGQVAQVVPAPYTLELDATVQRLLAEGFVGSLLTADIRGTSGEFVDTQSPLHWRQDARLSGINVLSLGIWYESAARWIGHARSVRAMTRTFVDTRVKSGTSERVRVEIPDHIDALAEMEGGAQVHIQVSAVTGLPPLTMEAWLFGSEGTLRVDAAGKRLFGARRGDSGLKEIEVPPRERVGWRVEEEFIAAVRGQEEVKLTTFQEGVRSMEFTEAVARAASSGATVTLPLS